MPTVPSPIDAAQLRYLDYRLQHPPFQPLSPINKHPAPPLPAATFTLLFLHGWPMSSEMWTHLLLPLSQTYGVRCIAPDRRGFGGSEWSGSGVRGAQEGGKVTYETFARDVVAVLEDAHVTSEWAIVGASMGCAEGLIAYEMLDGELKQRCTGFVWLGPSMPFPLQCEANPTAPPREVWDSILQGLRGDRVGFVKVAIGGVFGTRSVDEGGLGIELPLSKIEYFEHIVRQADALAVERCPMIITGHDSTEQLKTLDRKVLVLHGDSDQGMPASASADLISKLVPNGLCEVKMYEKAAHGLYLTHAGQVLNDILEFISTVSQH